MVRLANPYEHAAARLACSEPDPHSDHSRPAKSSGSETTKFAHADLHTSIIAGLTDESILHFQLLSESASVMAGEYAIIRSLLDSSFDILQIHVDLPISCFQLARLPAEQRPNR